MTEELYVTNENGNVLINTTHEEFDENYKLQLKIYNMHHSGKGNTIYCGCRGEPIKMYIAKNQDRGDNKGTIYLANYEGKGTEHSDKCNYNREFNHINDHQKGWEEDKRNEEKLIVNLSRSLIESTDSSIDNNNLDYKSLYSGSGGSSSPYQVSIYGLASRFALIVYRKHVQNRAKHPENINELLKYSYGQSNTIIMKTKSKRAHRKTLNDVWYKGKDGAHVGSSRFVFREFSFSNVLNDNMDDNYFMIRAPRPQDNDTVDDIGRVRKSIFNELADKIKSYARTNMQAGGKMLLSGFVQKKEDAYGYIYWEFASITILNVTKTGLLVDSGKETLAYHKAIEEGVLFYKPEAPLSYYNDWMPDMLFLRPLNAGKVYIGEIFGFNGKDYHIHTKNKINFIKESDNLDMWQWHANKNEDMPEFY